MQILKRRLEKKGVWGVHGSLNKRLSHFLLLYRSTPYSTTGRSLAELFLKRQLRTRFSLLKPGLDQTIENKQEKQRQQHDKTASRDTHIFRCGDRVGVRSFRGGKEKWFWGIATEVCVPRTYVVNVGGARRYVHVDHVISVNARSTDNVTLSVIPKPGLRPTRTENAQARSGGDVSHAANAQLDRPGISKGITVSNETTEVNRDIQSGVREGGSPVPASPISHPSSPEPRYPTRQRNPPNHLNL